jgi:hypothetical protein
MGHSTGGCVAASPSTPTSPFGAVVLVSMLEMQFPGQRVPAFPPMKVVSAEQHTRLSSNPEPPTLEGVQLPATSSQLLAPSY